MPREIKLKFKTNAEFSSQMSKDNTLFVYSLTMLPLLMFCTLVLCLKAYSFTMGRDAMQAKSISTISLAMMAYWGLVTILIAGRYYALGYINWWVAIGLQVYYFIYFFEIITILSAVLRAQMPGLGVNEIRKRQTYWLAFVEAVFVAGFLSVWLLGRFIMTTGVLLTVNACILVPQIIKNYRER